ncbi:MAG: hypothetical protein HND58_18155 [Planctomycetota bacterium]|nr:MAG: hypothetical protein HND58_18155 [Planctomycetota bacterium]
MNCRHCSYPLWNLRSGQCPECGTGFAPSEFRFAKNSVCFCCPHCDQRYFGTGPDGHLEPRRFVCVGCGQQIEMDTMVLHPADGLDEPPHPGGCQPVARPAGTAAQAVVGHDGARGVLAAMADAVNPCGQPARAGVGIRGDRAPGVRGDPGGPGAAAEPRS